MISDPRHWSMFHRNTLTDFRTCCGMTELRNPGAGMSPEQLREIIVQAAIPFLADWETVTTTQIARAAGIDEATLLTIFNDKEATLALQRQGGHPRRRPPGTHQDGPRPHPGHTGTAVHSPGPATGRTPRRRDRRPRHLPRPHRHLPRPLERLRRPRARAHSGAGTPEPTAQPRRLPDRRSPRRHQRSRHQTAGTRPGTPATTGRNPGRRLPRPLLRPQTNPTPKTGPPSNSSTCSCTAC